MNETQEWALIGYGSIGQEVARQLQQPEVAHRLGLSILPQFVMRSSGIMAPDGHTPMQYESLRDMEELPEVTFVALPSTDDGEVAYTQLVHILKRGKMAVTAEKGAMANYFSELRSASDNFKRLGVNATVGGGTRLINIGREYCRDRDNVKQIHLSLNGTLSAILSSVAPPHGAGMPLGQAAYQAMQLGYAEPGASSPYDVIRGEALGDIPKKTSIFFNAVGLSEHPLDWEDLCFDLSDEQISQVIEEAKIRRFIVSIYPEDYLVNHLKGPDNDKVSGFSVLHEGWRIIGGFRHIDRNPLFSPLADITGPGNGIVVGLGPDETDGVYALTGPGAGPRPTVNTMLDDYLDRRL